MSKIRAVGVWLCSVALAINGQVISGSVTDAINSKPIAGAIITVLELQKSCTTSVDGTFRTDSLTKGSFTAKAEAASYLAQSRTIVLAAPQEVGSAHVVANFRLYNISTNVDASKGNSSVKYFFPGHNVVEISIADSAGKTIRKVFDRSRKSGTREFAWDGKNNDGQPVPPGLYNCKLTSGNLVTMRKLVWKGPEPKVQ